MENPGQLLQTGLRLFRQGQAEQAIAAFERAVAAAPGEPQAVAALADCLFALGRADEAIAALEAGVARAPHAPALAFKLAGALRTAGRLEQAISLYRGLLARDPNIAEAHGNLGNALTRAGRFAEAIESFRRALALKPGSAVTCYNLAKALEEVSDWPGAEAAYRRALQLQPDFAEAAWSLAQLLWLQGRFAEAWPHYDKRLFRRGFERRPEVFAKPAWQGEPFEGRTLLLYAEQGQGDTIQFIRYLEPIKARGGRVVVECQPSLKRLFAGLPSADAVIARGEPLPDFDLQVSVMSAPAVFATTAGTIPGETPYLAVPPGESFALPGDPDAFKVGLVWAGNPINQPADSRRSFRFADYAPLLEVPGAQLYSLQVGGPAAELEAFAEDRRIIDLGPRLTDFAATAAAIGELDLVISSCTALPHLCGALGRECWLILGAVPDFRWHLEGDTTPWYPTLKLFRQQTRGDWAEPIGRVREALMQRL